MARKGGRRLDGFLNLDKSAGMSSAQAVARAMKLLDAAKAGHAGTLDPFATGVLPIAFGEATKALRLLVDGEKSYRMTVRWGEARSTDDRDGDVTKTSDLRPKRAEILEALPSFTGAIRQIPPAYSAIKVAGRRAYALARGGEAVELSARTVEIHAIELADEPDADHAVISVRCGKGAYMRALARDLGERLGVPAHLEALRRTRVGRFHEGEAISLEMLASIGHKAQASPPLLPISAALDDIPALALPRDEAERLARGQALAAPDFDRGLSLAAAGGADIVLVTTGTRLVALARREGAWLKPLRVFNLNEDERS